MDEVPNVDDWLDDSYSNVDLDEFEEQLQELEQVNKSFDDEMYEILEKIKDLDPEEKSKRFDEWLDKKEAELDRLEQEYNERERKKRKEEKNIQDLKKVKLTKKQQADIKEKADKIKNLYTVDKFIRLCGKISYENKLPAQILFHTIIGQGINDIKLSMNKDGSYIDPRIHLFWQQDSRSGKGKLMKVFNDVVYHLKKILQIRVVNGKRNILTDEFVVKKEDKPTTAALLNEWKRDKQGHIKLDDEGNPIMIMKQTEDADFITMHEAIAIFNKGSHTEGLPEFLITVCNPIFSGDDHIYMRNLNGYPYACPTRCDGSLILTTRELFGIDMLKAGSGLFARMITLFIWLGDKKREKILEKINYDMWNKEDESVDQTEYNKLLKEVCKEINDIYYFAKKIKGQLLVKNSRELGAYGSQKINEYLKRVREDIPNPDLRDKIMKPFIMNYLELVRKLSFHSAIMRKSMYIELIDVEYAWNIIEEQYKCQIEFVEKSVQIDRKRVYELNQQKKLIMQYFRQRQKQIVKLSELSGYICKHLNYSISHSYKIIERHCSGVEPLLKKATDKKIKLTEKVVKTKK